MSTEEQRLAPLREKIDALDAQILDLLTQRARAAQEVGHVKGGFSSPVFRPERERQVVARLQDINQGPLLPDSIAAIWQEVMSACRALEARQTIAYLGPVGTFSEQAAQTYFGHSIAGLPCVSLDEVFKAVEKGVAQFGVMPVENSSEGAISRTLDLLLDSSMRMSGEVVLPIRHHLLTKSGNLDGVSMVCAHAQALAQCQQWLSVHAPQLKRQAVSSNAEAARLAATDSSLAAIAGDPAQEAYSLQVVVAQIQDDPHNCTRFVVVGNYEGQPTGKDQTSLVLSVDNQPGAVHRLLAPLAKHGVSMNRFESRLARKGAWQYHFYIDIAGYADDVKVVEALKELREVAAFYKNLGSYPHSAEFIHKARMTSKIGLKYIHAIAPYVGGRLISEVAREYGLDENKIVKLASNENPLGMPKSAQEAMLKAASDLGRYPDSNGFELKNILSRELGVPTDWITLGNGSNDILELAARAVAQADDKVVFSKHAFAVYPLATQAVGAKAVEVAATATYGHDLPAMLAAVKAAGDQAKLVFVANPNNPTGSYLTAKAIEDFLVALPPHVVVVLDEAYNEYLTPEQRYDAIVWVKRFPNMILSRSLSKAYGLAGLRIGYGVAQPHLTDLLNRIRQPFNVNSLAQAAAIAAFQDKAFLQQGFELNRAGYDQLTNAFDRLGLQYLPSAGNFVLVKVGDDDQAGVRINLALLKRGIIVRPVGNYGLPQWLRISIGLPEENAAFITALEEILSQ